MLKTLGGALTHFPSVSLEILVLEGNIQRHSQGLMKTFSQTLIL